MKQLAFLIALDSLPFATSKAQSEIKNEMTMKVAVWDTYVTKKDGSVMHFDIIALEDVRDTSVIYAYGRAYLETKEQNGQPLTSRECRFCHIETLRPQWESDIMRKGYFIIEMENCE